jgi:hypothetical protein
VALPERVLESEGERDQPGVAVCQPQKISPETILRNRHIRLAQQFEPLVSKLLQLVVRLARNLLKIRILWHT